MYRLHGVCQLLKPDMWRPEATVQAGKARRSVSCVPELLIQSRKLCWQVRALLLCPCVKVQDLHFPSFSGRQVVLAAKVSSSVRQPDPEQQSMLTVNGFGAIWEHTCSTTSSATWNEISRVSTSSECVAITRSFAVKKRLLTSFCRVTGSRPMRCRCLEAYVNVRHQCI